MREKPKHDWGDLLRTARDQCHLSQDDLAKKTGLTVRGIGHYEQGRRTPELLQLLRIVLAFEEPQRSVLAKYLPVEVWRFASEQIGVAAKLCGLDIPDIILEALREELAVLSPDSSTDLKAQADINREVRHREHPAASSRKRPRSKIA